MSTKEKQIKNNIECNKLVMIRYGVLNFLLISAKDRVQYINLNQIKVKINDTYKKTEKISTNFEAVNGEDVLNKEYLDTKLIEVKGNILYIKKN